MIGTATGVSSGNTLNWVYTLNLKMSGDKSLNVKLDDWMFLQPGGVLLNRARMSKFGIEIGQITISFTKQPKEREVSMPLDTRFYDENIALTLQ